MNQSPTRLLRPQLKRCFILYALPLRPLPCIPPPELVKGFSCILHPLAGGWLLLLLLSSCAIGSSIYRFILCAVRKCFIYMWTRLAAKLYLNMRSRQSPSHPPHAHSHPVNTILYTGVRPLQIIATQCIDICILGVRACVLGLEHTFRRSWNSAFAFD